MAEQAQGEQMKPVGDTVPQVNGAVAVGEDLAFQRRWWRFERGVWIFFVLVLLADVSGLLGSGPLANAERRSGDGSLQVKYERVERENTASIVTVVPGAAAVHDGRFQLFVSDEVVKKLGAQRIIPEPQTSTLGNGGVTYTFAATTLPFTVQIELKPASIGTHRFTMSVPGRASVHAETVVLP